MEFTSPAKSLLHHPKAIYCITIVAFFIRLIFWNVYEIEHFNDAICYLENGKMLFETSTIKEHQIMPLYPIWAYVSNYLFGFPLLDIIISSLTCFLLFYLAILVTGSTSTGNIAAFIFAFYPFSVFYSISGLTETLFVFVTIGSFILLYKNKIWKASILMVLGILIRPTFDLANPVIIAAFTFFCLNAKYIQAAKNIAIYFVVYLFLMLPWWLFNYNRYHQFVRLNLGAGIVFYAGNNPINETGGGIYTDYDTSTFDGIKDPVQQNKAMMDAAIDYISEHPKRFLELAILKFFRLWRIWPHHEYYSSALIKVVSVMSYLPVLILFILFLFYSPKAMLVRSLPMLLLFLYLTAIHVITVGSLRYRYPLEPFMILFASIWLSRWKKISRYT